MSDHEHEADAELVELTDEELDEVAGGKGIEYDDADLVQ
jgi:hypothetical protein